ncbi:nickel-dependent lactate racemase family protein [[Eubacterium] cellulosolvens]
MLEGKNTIVQLPYGKERQVKIEVQKENLHFIAEKATVSTSNGCQEIVQKSIRNPIGRPPISSMVKSKDKIVIIGDDITRPTPQNIIIPIVLDELNSVGVPDKNIHVVVGLGTHRDMTKTEFRLKYGTVEDRVEITNHDYTDNLVNVGSTYSGIPIEVNKNVYDANIKIGIGNIVPHCYAGWGGGGKIIQPGVCGEKTTGMTHLMGGKVKPYTKILGTVDNDVRKEIEAAAELVGLDFIINTVLDNREKIVNVVSGEPIRALRNGVAHARKIFCPKISGSSDIIVVSSYPADIDYWQTLKPLTYASSVVKQGGTIVLLSPCPDGVSPTHSDLRDKAKIGYEGILESVSNGESDDIVAAGALLLHSQILERVNVICFSDGLRENDKEALGFSHANSPQEALEMAKEKHGKMSKVGILKCGEILPSIK